MNTETLAAVITALTKDNGQAEAHPAGSAYKVGRNYMFRTVTHIITGKLVRICHDGLVVADAAWVASTGRYAQAVAGAEFKEVEPYPDGAEVVVNWQAMIDACEIPSLPRSQK